MTKPINPEKFTIREVFNQKYKGGWREKERYTTITVAVLTRYKWENELAKQAGGIETLIALSGEYKFIPLYRIGDNPYWSSTQGGKHYGRYDQAIEWLQKTLEQYEEID